MKKDKICCIFSKRAVKPTEALQESVQTEIERLISCDCRTFYFCGRGDFEDVCYQTVTKLQQSYPEYQLFRVLFTPMQGFLHRPSDCREVRKYDVVFYVDVPFCRWINSKSHCIRAALRESDFALFYGKSNIGKGIHTVRFVPNDRLADLLSAEEAEPFF